MKQPAEIIPMPVDPVQAWRRHVADMRATRAALEAAEAELKRLEREKRAWRGKL